jgi:hypothetical protein
VNRAAPVNLFRDDLIGLVLAQQAQIEAPAQQIRALSARVAIGGQARGPSQDPRQLQPAALERAEARPACAADGRSVRPDDQRGRDRHILARAEAPLLAAVTPIAAAVRASPVVGSDETSARVRGKTSWQWELLSTTAVYHVIVVTRAASVVGAFLDGAQPEVWVADRYGGQLGHGELRQMCLAHLLRDAKYAIEEGDTMFAAGFRWLLLRAVAIGRRRETLKDTTLAQYRTDLDRRLDRLLSGPEPKQNAAVTWP